MSSSFLYNAHTLDRIPFPTPISLPALSNNLTEEYLSSSFFNHTPLYHEQRIQGGTIVLSSSQLYEADGSGVICPAAEALSLAYEQLGMSISWRLHTVTSLYSSSDSKADSQGNTRVPSTLL